MSYVDWYRYYQFNRNFQLCIKEHTCHSFIGTGGDIYIVVTSEKENKVGAVREAFQTVFGKAIVRGMVCTNSCNNNLFCNDIVHILIKHTSTFILLYFDQKKYLNLQIWNIFSLILNQKMKINMNVVVILMAFVLG